MTVYFVVFEWLYGATLGKLIFQKRVIQDDGSPCRLRPALVRALARLVDGILFGLVAYQQMKGPLRQRLGDREAHTLVVGASDPFIRQRRPAYWFLAAAVLFLGLDVVLQVSFLVPYSQVTSRAQLAAQLPAADLNLQAADVGRAYTLQWEGLLDLPSEDIRECHECIFRSVSGVVLTRLCVFKVLLVDTESDLAEAGQAWVQGTIDSAEDFEPLSKPNCADHASLQSFSGSDWEQNYVLAMVKRNVLVLVLSASSVDGAKAWDVGAWGCGIMARIR